jgi:hypothetical protein
MKDLKDISGAMCMCTDDSGIALEGGRLGGSGGGGGEGGRL